MSRRSLPRPLPPSPTPVSRLRGWATHNGPLIALVAPTLILGVTVLNIIWRGQDRRERQEASRD